MYRIGIDLGGTNIAAGIVNEQYEIVYQASVPTGSERDSDAIMEDMAALCHKLCAESGISIEEIASVGIASPGIANHDDGVVEYSCNLPFRKYPICAKIKERFPVAEVFVENDANAAAWGEAIAGAAKGTRNSVMITLGTGVGGGIIIDNKVYSGFNYAGAELGHIVIEVGGAPCSCGRRGCWEAYCSATALTRLTEEKMQELSLKGIPSLLFDEAKREGKVSARTAFNAMRGGDAYGKALVDQYLERLACGLGNIVNVFQPEIIAIGGGVSNEGESLVAPLRELVRLEQ